MWRTDSSDWWSVEVYGDVSLRFSEDGTLVYTIHLADKEQIMHLTYWVDGAWLVTDQPSSPRETRAEFFFTSDGRLAIADARSGRAAFYVLEE